MGVLDDWLAFGHHKHGSTSYDTVKGSEEPLDKP